MKIDPTRPRYVPQVRKTGKCDPKSHLNGWFKGKTKGACICNRGYDCEVVTKNLILANDDKRCGMVQLPKRNKANEPLRSKIFDVFGIATERRVNIKVIKIRSIHFHPEVLKSSNLGPIDPIACDVSFYNPEVSAIQDQPIIQSEDFYCIDGHSYPLPRTFSRSAIFHKQVFSNVTEVQYPDHNIIMQDGMHQDVAPPLCIKSVPEDEIGRVVCHDNGKDSAENVTAPPLQQITKQIREEDCCSPDTKRLPLRGVKQLFDNGICLCLPCNQSINISAFEQGDQLSLSDMSIMDSSIQEGLSSRTSMIKKTPKKKPSKKERSAATPASNTFNPSNDMIPKQSPSMNISAFEQGDQLSLSDMSMLTDLSIQEGLLSRTSMKMTPKKSPSKKNGSAAIPASDTFKHPNDADNSGEPVSPFVVDLNDDDDNDLITPVKPTLNKDGLFNFRTLDRQELRCNPNEKREVDFFMKNIRNSSGHVVARFKNHSLSRASMRRIVNGKWLNDEGVNTVAAVLNEKHLSNEAMQHQHISRWIFNSFFFDKFLSEEGYRYDLVKGWSNKVKSNRNIFGLDVLIFVVNRDENTHWACVVVYMKARSIYYYDSMKKNGKKYFDAILAYLRAVSRDVHVGSKVDNDDDYFKGWSFINRGWTQRPQSNDSNDCGVYMCTIMKQLMDTSRPVLTPQDIPGSIYTTADDIEAHGRYYFALALIKACGPSNNQGSHSLRQKKRDLPQSSEKMNIQNSAKVKRNGLASAQQETRKFTVYKDPIPKLNPLQTDSSIFLRTKRRPPLKDRQNYLPGKPSNASKSLGDWVATNQNKTRKFKVYKDPIQKLNPLQTGSSARVLRAKRRPPLQCRAQDDNVAINKNHSATSEVIKNKSKEENLLEKIKFLVAEHNGWGPGDTKLNCFSKGLFKQRRYSTNSNRPTDAKKIIQLVVEMVSEAMWPDFDKGDQVKNFSDVYEKLDISGRNTSNHYYKIGEQFCGWLGTKRRNDRRPMLAFVRATGVTKKQACVLMKQKNNMTNQEWADVGQHIKYPGPGEPIVKCHPNRRIKVSLLDSKNAMNILQNRNLIEDTAYGVKHVNDCHGRNTIVESIKRTDNYTTCYREYITALCVDMLPEIGDGTYMCVLLAAFLTFCKASIDNHCTSFPYC